MSGFSAETEHFHIDLHLTNSAANENFMYDLELDALHAKQQSLEKMKKLEVASGDSRRMVKEPADEDWKVRG